MDFGDLFKVLVWDALVKAALARLVAAIPFLGWGPVGWVVSAIVYHFGDKLYAALQMAVELELIALKNEAHRKAFDRAAMSLKVIGKDKGIDSPEFRKAKDDAKAALSEFVRFAA